MRPDKCGVDIAISIGHVCVPNELLKHNEGRICTYPFDWARSNIQSVMDVIRNGHEWHVTHNIERTSIAPSYTEHMYPRIEYPHSNYDTDVAKLTRASTRFFTTLTQPITVEFVYMSNVEQRISKEHLNAFITLVQSTFPQLKFHLTCAYFVCIGDSVHYSTVSSTDTVSTYMCEAPFQFLSNPMRGEYYERLYKTLFNGYTPCKLLMKLMEDNCSSM